MPAQAPAAPKADPRFQEIHRERVSDRVAQELLRLIAAGELAPGERLPGERQLAEMMHVSRVSVRAALQQLKAQGFVSAVQGGGTRVMAAADEIDSGLARLVQADIRNLEDLVQIRAHLEVWAARRAAVAATAAQLDEIDAALAVMSDPARGDSHKAEDDLRFHLAIAKASGSTVYLHLMTVLGEILERQFVYHRYSLYATADDDRRFLQQHRRITEAIRRRRPEAAAAAMSEHMASVCSRYGGAEAQRDAGSAAADPARRAATGG